jgi:hypothetical protein
MMYGWPAWATLIIALFALLLIVCWIVLPFAIIGTKPLLRQLVAELRRNNELLERRLPDLGRRRP